MAQIETWLKTDLKQIVRVQELDGQLFTADNQANLIGVIVTDKGAPVELSGSVYGYAIRSDGETVLINGSIDGNRAYVVLPASAYVKAGPIHIVIKIGDTTIGACTSYIGPSTTDTIVDPGHTIPSLAELLAQIENCRTATTAANNAASNANTKANAANTAASNATTAAEAANRAASAAGGVIDAANQAATNANAKATLANDAATLANEKAALADEKASLADTKATLASQKATAASNAADTATSKARLADAMATLAEQKATDADNAATAANNAASSANAAAESIDDMTVAASGLSAGASPTVDVSDVSGHKHIAFGIPKGDKGDPGKDFHLQKTFVSIAAMQAYDPDEDQSSHKVHENEFVMIDTGSVQDADTGKLFCYEPETQEVWRYIGDLSGSQGIRGETGTGIANIILNQDYTLTITMDDGTTSYTTPSIRGAQGAQGIQGDPGDPTELIDDTAGDSATDKVWSANKLFNEIGKVVRVQDTQPSDAINKVWIMETPPDGVQVPTYAEFEALEDEVDEKYEKPQTGIPKSDLASGVQASLDKADNSYQKGSSGIPKSDLADTVQTSLGKADSAYQKPQNGIPSSDLANGVIPDISGKQDAPATPGTARQIFGLDDNLNPVWVDQVGQGQIAPAVEEWLEENISNPDSPPLDRSLSIPSAAAPADLVGEIDSFIKDNDLDPATGKENVLNTPYALSDMLTGKIIYSDGSLNNSANRDTSPLIPVSEGTYGLKTAHNQYVANIDNGNNYKNGYGFFAADGETIVTRPSNLLHEITTDIYVFDVPQDAKYVRFCYSSQDEYRETALGFFNQWILLPNANDNIDSSFFVLSPKKPNGEINKIMRIDGSYVAIADLESRSRIETLEALPITFGRRTCAIFEKVCCIGDSYTEGYIVDSSDVAHTNKAYSWVEHLKNMTGRDYVNLGIGGATSASWLTSERGLAKAQLPENKAQAYIIGLQINDAAQGLTVGTTADIGTSVQSYYGCTSKIIDEMFEINDDAHVFLLTQPKNYTGEHSPYRTAILNIVDWYQDDNNGTHQNQVHLIDLLDYWQLFRNAGCIDAMYGGHYTPVGYEYVAEIMMFAWSNYINAHPLLFQDVNLIPFGTES